MIRCVYLHRWRVVLALCFGLIGSGWSSDALARQELSKPSDMSKISFRLLTVGLGSMLHTRFGHSILQLTYEDSGRQGNLNWGIFDFNAPNFAWNYFKGIQIYQVGSFSTQSVLRIYRDGERRKVWSEKLNLNDAQKQILVDRIFWNLKKENIEYDYQHFYNNCSTKIRDYLDEALGGAIKAKFSSRISKRKFRDYVNDNLNAPPFFAFSLDILMNDEIDGDLSEWHEMFYPIKMRELLLDFPQLDDTGKPIPGTKLLDDTKVIVDNPDYAASKDRLYFWVFGAFMIPLLWIALGSRRPLSRFKGFVFGIVLSSWSVFSGVFGLVMAMSWIFSNHQDILHNANLWLLWPTDFAYLIPGLLFVVNPSKARELLGSRLVGRLARWSFVGHLVGGLLLAVLWSVGVIQQDVRAVLAFLVPISGFVYVVAYVEGSRARGPSS